MNFYKLFFYSFSSILWIWIHAFSFAYSTILCENIAFKPRSEDYLRAAIKRHPIGGPEWFDFALRFNNSIRKRQSEKMTQLQIDADAYIESAMQTADRQPQRFAEIEHWTPNIEQDVRIFWKTEKPPAAAADVAARRTSSTTVRGKQRFLTGLRVPCS